jgi:hypothetical protein
MLLNSIHLLSRTPGYVSNTDDECRVVRRDVARSGYFKLELEHIRIVKA